jgi:predicted ArsR family transcriptional regulator
MPNQKKYPLKKDGLRIGEAARYLKMSERAIRKHLYVVHDLEPDGYDQEGQLRFTRSNLDQFRLRKRSRGRPVAANYE